MLCVVAAVVMTVGTGPSVNTQYGRLNGLFSREGVGIFKGIPYASPPVGANRFKDPVAWSAPYPAGSRDATAFGKPCISGSQGGAEDCLFANVYSPSATADHFTPPNGLPVLFFIHGGSFISGAGSIYNATVLAKKHNVVVVTINYRLGSLGWLQPEQGVGNFGHKDQTEALKFVRRASGGGDPQQASFLAGFGGDISRMLLFGESAGAISVAMHLVTKESFGLFSAALVESGFPFAKPITYSLSQSANFSSAAGCPAGGTVPVIECLQQCSLERLTKIEGTGGNPFLTPSWGYAIDTAPAQDHYNRGSAVPSPVLPVDPLTLYRQKALAPNVTVAAGSNSDEGWLFVYPQNILGMDANAYRAFVTTFLTSNGRVFNATIFDKVMQLYPPKTGLLADNRAAAASVIGDATFVCGGHLVADAAASRAAAGLAPSYQYHFAWSAAPKIEPVTHASELPFVFDTGSHPKHQEAMSTGIGVLWSALAVGGTALQDSEWIPYAADTDVDIVLDIPTAGTFGSEKARRSKFCKFWLGEAMPVEIAGRA